MENACGDSFPVIMKCKALRDTRGIPPFLREEGNIVFFLISFLGFKRIFKSQCGGRNCGGEGDNGRVNICVKRM